jgi:hypothetical protein
MIWPIMLGLIAAQISLMICLEYLPKQQIQKLTTWSDLGPDRVVAGLGGGL